MGMNSYRRVLFVGLGETEVPAFARIALQLNDKNIQTKVVTWLPRLVEAGVESLAFNRLTLDREEAAAFLAPSGIPHPSMAADFDRDWYFATASRKEHHVLRIAYSLKQAINEFEPTDIVSSVGGETTRMVADAYGRFVGIPLYYFNAIPLPRRFVILPSMAAPFVPWGDNSSHPAPSGQREESQFSQGAKPPRKPEPSLATAALEGLVRATSFARGRDGLYPPGWVVRTGVGKFRQSCFRRYPKVARGVVELRMSTSTTNVLYPLHDERDFQVAVRERHAVPQEKFLLYVSSVLPSSYHLWIKPHPEFVADHNPLFWRDLAHRPNVSFLRPDVSFEDAIAESDIVMTLSSTLGFEALQRHVPVVCYGSPFYSGRGLTTDVRDIRDISAAITRSLDSVPSPSGIEDLKRLMMRMSWPGQFTPIDASQENLEDLANGLFDAITKSDYCGVQTEPK
jgi:capsular polysaccharide export protein